jgi:hypothetical protein
VPPQPALTHLSWSSWASLDEALHTPVLPAKPGLYRIRRAACEELDYIGQTGRSLRGRLRMLRGIVGAEMPYRDPHTAAPALWAVLQEEPFAFEVSVAEVDGAASWRKGLEALAIALYRQETGRSPSFNFGRMPAGYVMSSGNNARLVAGGKRFRGGPSALSDASHLPSIAPAGSLHGDPQGSAWGGHVWSDWLSLGECSQAPHGDGLYRIRGPARGLTYIGEGAIRARLETHRRKTLDPSSRRLQDQTFHQNGPLEFSSVAGAWVRRERLELETDLIGSHVLELGRAPAAQFIG